MSVENLSPSYEQTLQAIIKAAKERGQIQRRSILHGLDQAQKDAKDTQDGAIGGG